MAGNALRARALGGGAGVGPRPAVHRPARHDLAIAGRPDSGKPGFPHQLVAATSCGSRSRADRLWGQPGQHEEEWLATRAWETGSKALCPVQQAPPGITHAPWFRRSFPLGRGMDKNWRGAG